MAKPKESKQLFKMRHSAEHVLTQAMLKLYPGLKMAMGPATKEGFYFDFDYDGKISADHFPAIESEMRKILAADLPITREEISISKARALFKENEYKQEWIDEIEKKGAKAVIYRTGKDFVDLCSGPHVKSTGQIGFFKLLSVAGAYWRGDEKNKMLTRIYGTTFPTQKELDQFIRSRAEEKKRDHRKIGKTLELFAFADEIGSGLPLWLPKGTIIKDELEKWAEETEKEWGYLRVRTPHIGKKILYEISGHLPYYDEDMYPPLVDKEGEIYYLKPMNCPHHHMIYKSRIRSYKELPLRLAEYGEVYRYEQSGELHGLLRVRFISQNDAHIYCRIDQAKDEFKKVIQLHRYYYEQLGLKNYYMELALRDPRKKDKYHGDEKMWRKAAELTRKAMQESGVPYTEEEGEAAFYGPKVDFKIKAVTGKEFGASTSQLDLYMAERFNLSYVGDDGKEHTPAIIHRAPLGSSERFVGFLIEHFAGAFPVWLHPVQAKLLPVSDKFIPYAQKVAATIKQQIPGVRQEIDFSDETLGNKIRKAQEEKIPYMLIVGGKEEKTDTLNLRLRTEKEIGAIAVERFAQRAKKIINERSLELWQPTKTSRV